MGYRHYSYSRFNKHDPMCLSSDLRMQCLLYPLEILDSDKMVIPLSYLISLCNSRTSWWYFSNYRNVFDVFSLFFSRNMCLSNCLSILRKYDASHYTQRDTSTSWSLAGRLAFNVVNSIMPIPVKSSSSVVPRIIRVINIAAL